MGLALNDQLRAALQQAKQELIIAQQALRAREAEMSSQV
jgi:hypothetical protein